MDTITVRMNGEMKKKKVLMKILGKAKVQFEHIWKNLDDEGNEFYDIKFKITGKQFGKHIAKLDKLGDLTIG